MGMFDRATPDGYPEDNGYSVNSNALLQRWRFAKENPKRPYRGGPDLRTRCDRPTQAGILDVTQRIVGLAAVRMTGTIC